MRLSAVMNLGRELVTGWKNLGDRAMFHGLRISEILCFLWKKNKHAFIYDSFDKRFYKKYTIGMKK